MKSGTAKRAGGAYAVVAYIPALHRGYFDFFRKYPGKLYILGSEFVKEVPRMERDIRSLAPEEIKMLLDHADFFSEIAVLDRTLLKDLAGSDASIVMPDEDVSWQFAETYLPGKPVEFVPTFLRWDRQISTKEFEVSPDRIISTGEFDKEVMAEALAEAGKSPDWWRQIGAILVRDKKAVLIAHNEVMPSEYTLNAFGDPRSNFDAGEAPNIYKTIHAEQKIIALAAKRGISTEGASLYSTTFPCPPCAKSIAVAGIREVYYLKGYSLLDAEDILRAFGVKIIMVK